MEVFATRLRGNTRFAMTLELNLSLCLPRDQLSVPIVRHICSYALDEVGVTRSCKSDVSLALTEACTNVLDHVTEGDNYEVHIGINNERCTITVKDAGGGFDFGATDGRASADGNAESGRGLHLMRELVDNVHFMSTGDDGTTVQLEKDLEFDESHPVRQRLA